MTTLAQTGPGPAVAAFLERVRATCGIAVIQRNEIAWSRTTGGDQMTLFQAGSVSKPVAALAALELAGSGAIDLDADVNTALTSWRLPRGDGVTLRHLLGHTSGVGVPFMPGYPKDGAFPTPLESLDGTAPARTPPVQADPAVIGSFSYSGGGYSVVQQLIADVTGQPFAAAAAALVFGPLGMTDSTFEQPLPVARRSAAARGDWHVYPEAAAAGLWTTPADLARFALALQSVAAGRPSPLHSSTARLLLLPRAQLPGRGEWMLFPLLGVRLPDNCGLGMFLTGDEWFGHVGGSQSFVTMLTASTLGGAGAVGMIAANAMPLLFRLMRTISVEEGWSGFRQRGLGRLTGLPGSLRSLI